MIAILFTNWTDEDFSHTWNGEPYEFKKGESILLPEYLATHFAKHLVDRELQKRNLTVNHFSRPEFISKTLGTKPVDAPSPEKLEIELLNAKPVVIPSEKIEAQPIVSNEVKRFCDTCDSKGVKHKKECPKLKKQGDEEFAGLNNAV